MTEKELQDIYKKEIMSQYKDKDSFVWKEYVSEYYYKYCKLLTNKLNSLAKEKQDEDFKKRISRISFKCHKEKEIFNKNHMGIFMIVEKEEGREDFQLKSDQFGFSIKDDGYNHPYYIYLKNALKDKPEEKDAIVKKINNWKDKTREDGCGAFLWSLEKLDDDNPKYNKDRGGTCVSDKRHYIQDRVDLTLYEIKEVYENIIANISSMNILNRSLYESKMYSFLKTFENFSTFVKVFGFEGNFVRKIDEEWKVVNIFDTKINDLKLKDANNIKYIDDNYINELRDGKHLLTKSTPVKDLENMFEVVCELIEERRKKLRHYRRNRHNKC